MAQHHSLLHAKPPLSKTYQRVLDSIKNQLRRGITGVSGSLKFEELPECYRLTTDDRVFITERSVNGRREIFELHYDTKKEEIIDVFFVI